MEFPSKNSVLARVKIFPALLTAEAVCDFVLFPCLFLFALLWIDPSLNYRYPGTYRLSPTETYSSWSIADTPFYPGKVLDAAASIVTPWFAHPAAGALLITIIAFVLCLLDSRLLAALGAKRLWPVKYAPVIILAYAYYCMLDPLRPAMAFAVGLAFATAYAAIGARRRAVRLSVFIACALFVLFISPMAFPAFALACLLYEFFIQKGLAAASVEAALAACAPALFPLLLPLHGIREAYGLLLPPLPSAATAAAVLPFTFWLMFPLILMLAVLYKMAARALPSTKRKMPQGLPAPRAPLRGLIIAVMIIALFAAVLLTIRKSAAQGRCDAMLNAAMVARNWDLVLRTADRLPRRTLLTTEVHLIDRALYSKGRLLSDLFLYPQTQAALLLFPYTRSDRRADRFWEMAWGAPTWFDLGMVNTAEHCVLETMAQSYCPEQLRLAAKIYLVKNMTAAAHTCLSALHKDGAYRRWVSEYMDSLARDTALSFAPEILRARCIMMKREFVLTGVPPLVAMVREHPDNRMAFEYLVAWELVGRNLDSLPQRVPGFRALGYRNLPPAFEEALILCASTKEPKPDLCGFTLSSAATDGFQRFYDIFYVKHGGKSDEAFYDLLDSCGDSFFFYYLYGFSKASVGNDKR